MAGTDAGEEAAHAGRDRASEQDGASHLGHDDETGGLQDPDADCRRIACAASNRRHR